MADLHRIGSADELHKGGDLDVVFAQIDRFLDLAADVINEGSQLPDRLRPRRGSVETAARSRPA